MSNLDILWVVICCALVFLMQAGFLCLESGLTRTKNSVNVAIKNLADFCLTTIVFWAVGYSLMFGDSELGLWGRGLEFSDFSAFPAEETTFFLFQVMFCGATVTIISGAVAERLRFGGYLVVALLVSGLVYPVAGHWAWSSLNGGGPGILARHGFVDFAGSSVVHSVGGWSALALLIVVGPRLGRFDGSMKTAGSSLPIATLGVLLLFIGWLGFNGGSTLAMNEDVPSILVNTVIAGSAGALAAGGLGYAVNNHLNVTQFMNGTLGGLVAVTASCFAVTTPVAALIGVVGGMIVVFAEKLLERLKLDDAVGSIPVHLAAGIWGTVATGLYGNLDILGTGLSRLEQIWIQLVGVFIYGAWAFGVSYVLFYLVDRILPFRVSKEHELAGLNFSEHGIRQEMEDAAPVASNY